MPLLRLQYSPHLATYLDVSTIHRSLVPCPQVLLVVVKAIIDGLGEFGSDFGAGDVVARAVAARVLAQVRRRLRDDQDLVHVAVIQLAVRVFVRPIGEGVFARGGQLLHLLIE